MLLHEKWREGRACARCGAEFEFDWDYKCQGLRECSDCESKVDRPEIEHAIQATRFNVSHEEHSQCLWTKLDRLTVHIGEIQSQLRNRFLLERDTKLWQGERRKFAMEQLTKAERAIEEIFDGPPESKLERRAKR